MVRWMAVVVAMAAMAVGVVLTGCVSDSGSVVMPTQKQPPFLDTTIAGVLTVHNVARDTDTLYHVPLYVYAIDSADYHKQVALGAPLAVIPFDSLGSVARHHLNYVRLVKTIEYSNYAPEYKIYDARVEFVTITDSIVDTMTIYAPLQWARTWLTLEP